MPNQNASKKIDALEICEDLRRRVGVEAMRFYKGRLDRKQNLGEKVLERGSTDFDQKHYPDDLSEKPHYKTDAYIWQHMKMHIKQSLVVLREYLDYGLTKDMRKIVFVDLGCGPMTSGLALAEIMPDSDITYLGIDASCNMVKRAKWINCEYKAFEPDRFRVVQGDTFDPQAFDQLSASKCANLAILNMSFVLAPDTLKVAKPQQHTWVKELAQAWDQWVGTFPNLIETRIIYTNPRRAPRYRANFHENWEEFQNKLQIPCKYRKGSVISQYRNRDRTPNLVTDPKHPVKAVCMVGKK